MKLKYSKPINHQTRYLIKAFVLGVPALSAAKFAKVHRNTAGKFFKKIRLKIALRNLVINEENSRVKSKLMRATSAKSWKVVLRYAPL